MEGDCLRREVTLPDLFQTKKEREKKQEIEITMSESPDLTKMTLKLVKEMKVSLIKLIMRLRMIQNQ